MCVNCLEMIFQDGSTALGDAICLMDRACAGILVAAGANALSPQVLCLLFACAALTVSATMIITNAAWLQISFICLTSK